MNILIKQTLNLIKQNRFFSIVSVLGTAISIAFAMTFYMTYYIHISNMHPETNRDRMIISGNGYFFKTSDNSNCNDFLSLTAARTLFDKLPGAELVSYYTTQWNFLGNSDKTGKRCQVMWTDSNFWKIMDIKILAGRTFTKEDCEEENAGVIVISEKLARDAFGSPDAAIGKTYFRNFKPYRVIGVTENISSLFTYAYSDAWIPLNMGMPVPSTLSLDDLFRGASCQAIILRRKNVNEDGITDQIDRSLLNMNSHLADYTFQLNDCTTYANRQFFREKGIDRRALFAFLIMLVLIVPAINISGLISSQMGHRQEEIGIRKAYGADRWRLIRQLLLENLILCIIGALLGFLLSIGIMEMCKDFLLAATSTLKAGSDFNVGIWMFFRPVIIICVVLVCLLFNLMSVFFPAWWSTRKNIVTILKRE